MPRIGYDLRPVVPMILYLITYAVMDQALAHAGLVSVLGDFTMTAGLNFGLLLLHGFWYAPVVLLATVADGLWCHPLPYSVPLTSGLRGSRC